MRGRYQLLIFIVSVAIYFAGLNIEPFERSLVVGVCALLTGFGAGAAILLTAEAAWKRTKVQTGFEFDLNFDLDFGGEA